MILNNPYIKHEGRFTSETLVDGANNKGRLEQLVVALAVSPSTSGRQPSSIH